MCINKNFVHQVGDQTKVILRYTVNQPSRLTTVVSCVRLYSYIILIIEHIGDVSPEKCMNFCSLSPPRLLLPTHTAI
jgi:hypothetical protein